MTDRRDEVASILSSSGREELERERKAWEEEFNQILEERYSHDTATRHDHHRLWPGKEFDFESETKHRMAKGLELLPQSKVSYSEYVTRPPTTFWSYGLKNSVPYNDFVINKGLIPLGATSSSFRRRSDFTSPIERSTRLMGGGRSEEELVDSVQRRWLAPPSNFDPFEILLRN